LSNLALDHVLIAVGDLGAGASEFEARYGLRSVEGGRHPAWGTANRVVPLGDAYVELVAVVDPAAASESAFGRWVAGAATAPCRPLGWAVRTDDLDTIAVRLGLAALPGSRVRPDGTAVSWRIAGVRHAAAEPCLPFFVEWEDGTVLPGRTAFASALTVASIRVRGDRGRLGAWLDEAAVPLEVEHGPPAVVEVVLVDEHGRTTSIA
jgi:hypothetical protein